MSGDCAEHITRSEAFTGRPTYCWRFHFKQPRKQDNDRTSSRDRKKKKKGPVLCTAATQMTLFEHVSKHSLRFYHMALVWTPPCSALLYSFYTFQSDRLASSSVYTSGFFFALLCFTSTSSLSLHSIHLPLLCLLSSFVFIWLWHHSHTSLCTFLCYVIFAASAFLLKWEEYALCWEVTLVQNYTSNSQKLHCS